MVLECVGSLGVLGSHDTSADDLNGAETSTMPARHLRVELVDRPRESQVTVLAVHIVCATAGVILEPDGVVLDDARVALHQLVDVQNLPRGLLHLVHLVEEVPETGLGHHLVGRKDLHAVDGGVGVGICGDVAAHHLVLTEA